MSIKIYLEEEKRSRFKAVCALENLSMNEVLLGMLEDWLEKHALPAMTADRAPGSQPTEPAAKPTAAAKATTAAKTKGGRGKR